MFYQENICFKFNVILFNYRWLPNTKTKTWFMILLNLFELKIRLDSARLVVVLKVLGVNIEFKN